MEVAMSAQSSVSPEIVKLKAEIAKVKEQIAELETIGPPLEERQEAAINELRRAEDFYRQRGLPLPWLPGAMTAGETFMALVGFIVACDGNACIEAERRRVEADFKARSARGMSRPAKAERRATLKAKERRLSAQCEIACCAAEANGQPVKRDADALSAEMFLRTHDDLVSIAGGKEPVA
jgi:hypothetical protein